MEFLEIEMSKEEQLAFFATQNQKMANIEAALERLTIGLEEYKLRHQLGSVKQEVTLKGFEEDEFYDQEPRSIEDVINAIDEFVDKIWFNRHLSLRYRIEIGAETVHTEIWKGALESAQKVIEKYGDENLGPYSDFEWGMLNGKLSALRWVLGDDWDLLDT